jgi:hypothetical protein
MRLVAACLPKEFRAIAVVLAILAHEALVTSPRPGQRSIHAEVLARQPAPALGLSQHLVEQHHHGVVLDQPLAVLAEHRRHPYVLVRDALLEGGRGLRNCVRASRS